MLENLTRKGGLCSSSNGLRRFCPLMTRLLELIWLKFILSQHKESGPSLLTLPLWHIRVRTPRISLYPPPAGSEDEDRGVDAPCPHGSYNTGWTDIPLMKDKLARATWSFKGHGALSDVDTKQNSSRLNGTRRPLCSRTALRVIQDWRHLPSRMIALNPPSQYRNSQSTTIPPRRIVASDSAEISGSDYRLL